MRPPPRSGLNASVANNLNLWPQQHSHGKRLRVISSSLSGDWGKDRCGSRGPLDPHPAVQGLSQSSGTYLAGRVFTRDAALWLRRTGLAGISAVIVSVLVRVVIASILVGRLVPISPRGYYYLLPQDLLHAIFAVFVFALAHIFKAAAEMAEDQAQIV